MMQVVTSCVILQTPDFRLLLGAKMNSNQVKLGRLSAIAASVVITLSIVPVEAQAWNIVCGISVGFTGRCEGGEALLARQYEVDSKLLKGISEYTAALSEFQLIN